MNRFSLSNKVIVVTGAAGILGKKFCKELLNAGAEVVAIDYQNDMLNLLNEDLKSASLHTYCVDIRSREQLSSVSASIISKFGRIDCLLNNAATKSPNFFEPFETFPIDDWDHVMSVNLTGSLICAQLFGGQMVKQGCGSIVNVLSIYGIVAPDQRTYEGSEYLGRAINTPAVYSASKAALWGLTKYLASYWGEKNIRVNALTPGGIESGQNKTFNDRYSNRVPMARMGQSDDLIGALIYLLSDASSYVTGQNIIVDGGLTVW